MDKYFIGYPLKGKAKSYHKRISKQLASKFNSKPTWKRVPPHFTFKAPFDAKKEQIKEIKNVLTKTTQEFDPPNLYIDGFGHFGDGVVFLNGKTSDTAKTIIKNLVQNLKKLDWLIFEKYDTEEQNLHATLAYPNGQKEFSKMWNYLKEKDTPSMKLNFDRISLFKKKSNWKIYSNFSIN